MSPRVYLLLFTTVLLACAIFLFRQTLPPDLFEHSDKFVHAGSFFALALLGYLTASGNGIPFPLLLSPIIVLAVGSEWIQDSELLPLRHGDAGNVAANLVGCILGLIAAMIAAAQRTRCAKSSIVPASRMG